MPRGVAFRPIVLLAGSLFSCLACAQRAGVYLPIFVDAPEAASHASSTGRAGENTAGVPVPVTVAAGTKILMVLNSPLHSTSAVQESGIYLETLEPVIQEDRVVVPARTRVQGVVESSIRPGHFRRTAEFKFHFTALIFPNNRVVSIRGGLLSIPGAKDVRTQPAQDGKLRTVDQSDKAVVAAVSGATGGAIVGSVAHLGIGKFVGSALGAGLGLEAVLLKRGDEISLAKGTLVEMVLQTPFTLGPEQAAFNARYVPPPELRPQNSALNNGKHNGDSQEGTQRSAKHLPRSLPWTRGILLPE